MRELHRPQRETTNSDDPECEFSDGEEWVDCEETLSNPNEASEEDRWTPSGSGPGWFLAADETSLKSKPKTTARAAGQTAKDRWRVPHVPMELPSNDTEIDDSGIFVSVDFADNSINSAEEELEIQVTIDSGAVDHVIATDHLPSSAEIAEVSGTRVGKTFVAANGLPMQTFGECVLQCRDEHGTSCSSFAVTEVTRPLQSVSRMCDQGLEVLFTRTEAKVRDPKTGRYVAVYPRRGGLYTRSVKVKGGTKPQERKGAGKGKSSFTRPSTKP